MEDNVKLLNYSLGVGGDIVCIYKAMFSQTSEAPLLKAAPSLGD